MTILDKTKEAFNRVRGSLVEAMSLLWETHSTEAFKAEYEHFGDYVESELGISKSTASKYLAVWEHYALEGRVSHAKLAEVEPEKLYLALKLPGKPEKQFSQALTLSRQELKTEINDPDDTCSHDEKITICANCHRRV